MGKNLVKVHLLRIVFVEVLFVGIVFVSSTASSHLITESTVILPAYLPFSQVHVAVFQKKPFSHTQYSIGFCTHTDFYRYSTFDSSYIFHHQTFTFTWNIVNVFDFFIPVN